MQRNSTITKVEFPVGLRSLPLVGSYYRDSHSREVLDNSQDNWIAFLKRDVGNAHDKNAFKIFLPSDTTKGKWYWIGFVQRHSAAKLMKFLAVLSNYTQNDVYWNDSEHSIVALLRRVGASDFEVLPLGIVNKEGGLAATEKFHASEELRVSLKLLADSLQHEEYQQRIIKALTPQSL